MAGGCDGAFTERARTSQSSTDWGAMDARKTSISSREILPEPLESMRLKTHCRRDSYESESSSAMPMNISL